MARERMVTRTVESNIYSIMAVDMATLKVVEFEHSTPKGITEKQLDKSVIAACEEKNYKYVTRTALRTESKLYGMTEAAFIANAIELPPRSSETETE